MTDKQPEALRLAELLDKRISMWDCEAAAELRRLHEVNAELVEALRDITVWYSARDSENEILPAINQNPEIYRAMQALDKAQGDNNANG